MKVAQILADKGNSVVTVRSEGRVGDAVNLLNAHNIGAVIVIGSDGAIAGVLSERDVVRRLSSDGVEAVNLPIKACMTPNPYTCGAGASLDEIMGVMTEKRIRHLPVVEGGRLMGVISIGDVVKRKIETVEKEAAALKDYIAST